MVLGTKTWYRYLDWYWIPHLKSTPVMCDHHPDVLGTEGDGHQHPAYQKAVAPENNLWNLISQYILSVRACSRKCVSVETLPVKFLMMNTLCVLRRSGAGSKWSQTGSQRLRTERQILLKQFRWSFSYQVKDSVLRTEMMMSIISINHTYCHMPHHIQSIIIIYLHAHTAPHSHHHIQHVIHNALMSLLLTYDTMWGLVMKPFPKRYEKSYALQVQLCWVGARRSERWDP